MKVIILQILGIGLRNLDEIAKRRANAVNLVAKTVYAFLAGAKDFAIKLGISVAFIIASSLFVFFFA